MTSCNQLRDNLFFLFFQLIIEYFFREIFELSIGIYISMKSTFFKSESLEKMMKTSKIVLQKQSKKKLTSNNENNKKRI